MANNISIRHLRAFIEIANNGSFTRAADNLHQTQSTLTAAIKQIETQSGIKLFDRTTRRVLLTDAGATFLPVAEKLLSDFDAAFNDLEAISSRQKGHVGIAASPSMMVRVLPDVVSEYKKIHPKISIYLRDDNAGGIEQRVLDNDVDFGIGANHSGHTELHYQPVIADRYGAVLPDSHPLASKNTLNWRSISGQQQVYLTEDSGTRTQIDTLDQAAELSLDQAVAPIEVSTPAGLAELVKAGLGISILPAMAASTEAFATLKFIPLTTPVVKRDICIITRQGRSLSPAADSLLKILLQHFDNASLPDHVDVLQ